MKLKTLSIILAVVSCSSESKFRSGGASKDLDSSAVAVAVVLDRVEVNPGHLMLNMGDIGILKATAIYSNEERIDITDKAKWSLSAKDCCVLEENVRGVKLTSKVKGTTAVVATYEGKTATADVEVIGAGDPTPKPTPGPATPKPTLAPSSSPKPSSSPGSCPMSVQNILVLDGKSGWWAGDAGDFFERILSNTVSRCNGLIKFEFHHFMNGDTVSNSTADLFPRPASGNTTKVGMETDFNKYTQIWILSGSHLDGADVQPTDAAFIEIKNKIKSSKANLLLGAGLSSNNQVTSIAAHLGLGLSVVSGPVFTLVSPSTEVKISSTIKPSMADHFIFTGLSTFADNVVLGGQTLKGDSLDLTGTSPMKVVASNTEGGSSIAVGVVNKRRIVVDAGLQRFYAIETAKGQTTLALLNNIMAYLAGN